VQEHHLLGVSQCSVISLVLSKVAVFAVVVPEMIVFVPEMIVVVVVVVEMPRLVQKTWMIVDWICV
jgi:hypothetical protein